MQSGPGHPGLMRRAGHKPGQSSRIERMVEMYSFIADLDGRRISRKLKTVNPETAAMQAMVYTATHGGEDSDVQHYRLYLYRNGNLAAATAGYGWHMVGKSLPQSAFYN